MDHGNEQMAHSLISESHSLSTNHISSQHQFIINSTSSMDGSRSLHYLQLWQTEVAFEQQQQQQHQQQQQKQQ